MKTKNLIMTAMFSVLITVGAFLKIPLFSIPITCQSIFVLLAGLVLGAKRGAVSVLLYIVLGLLGLPVFSGGGGIMYVLQPTFGFLLGFCASAFLFGYFCEKRKIYQKNIFLLSLLSMIPMYIIGTAYYMLLMNFYFKESAGLLTTLYYCVLVFIPGDILKCIFTSVVALKIRGRI